MIFTSYSAQMNAWTATDAGFRIWGKAWTDMLDTIGLTQVYSDIDWETAVMPTAATTYAGKRVYKFNDSLSETREIYVSVEFGRGSNTTASFGFAIRLTVGTAHDSGTVTNYVMQQYFTMTQAPTDGGDIWGVKSDAGFSIYTNLNVNSISTMQAGFAIQRLCVDGSPSPDGVIMMWAGQACDLTGMNSTAPRYRVANYLGGQVFNSTGGQTSANSSRGFMNYQAIPDTIDSSYAGKAPAITLDTFGKYDPVAQFIIVSKFVYSPATEFDANINGELGTYRIPYSGFCVDNGAITNTYALLAFRMS